MKNEKRNVLNENRNKGVTRSKRHKLFRWLPALIWMGVIFYLSSKTGDDLNRVIPFFQKFFPFMEDFNWGHYVSYFILAICVDFGLGSRARNWKGKILVVVICILYGITDEIHQSFVGGRMMDIIDVRNDGIGATCWVLLECIPFIRSLWKKLSLAV